MPTKPTPVTLQASNVDILNRIRANSSTLYQDRIPVATQQNLKSVGQAIMQFDATANEFLKELVNRIGRVLISSKSYNNPLRFFKKGLMEYGDTIEEIYVGVAHAHQYNPNIAEKLVYKREIPDVSAVFHKRNYQNFYKTTIQQNDLKAAFLSNSGLQTLINGIIDSLYTGSELDEFIIMKEMIAEAANSGRMMPITVPAGRTADDMKATAAIIKSTSNKLEFMSNKYNSLGVLTRTPKRDQYLIIDAAYDAYFDVNVLASAFNMDKTEFMGHKVLIDDFGGLERQGVVAALVDKDWWMVLDNDIAFRDLYNPEGLYWNYWYHVWKTFSTSPFCNAILFTTGSPTVTGVTITPTATNAPKGTTVQFKVTVDGTGIPSHAVQWSVEGATDSYMLTSDSKLVIGEDEKAGTITVTATSIYNPAQSATATVTVV